MIFFVCVYCWHGFWHNLNKKAAAEFQLIGTTPFQPINTFLIIRLSSSKSYILFVSSSIVSFNQICQKISIFVAPENKTRRVKVMATSVFAYVLITSNKKTLLIYQTNSTGIFINQCKRGQDMTVFIWSLQLQQNLKSQNKLAVTWSYSYTAKNI